MSKKIDILARKLMILASAGSGKTYQLGNRVIGLVAAQNVDPERIVALTFTRKAAGEFADAVLTKLAKATENRETADILSNDIGAKNLDFGAALVRVVRSLPRLQLGTMDGFFARVVRAFQYELGLSGGTFALLEGQQWKEAQEDIISSLLGSLLDGGEADKFLYAFRRATYGKEEQKVSDRLQEFVKSWHGRWKSGISESSWDGAAFSHLPKVEQWEAEKSALASGLRKAVEGTTWTSAGQGDAMDDSINLMESHTIGSGKLGDAKAMLERILEQVACGADVFELKFRKDFKLSREASDLFRDTILLAAHCELAAAVERTRAVKDLLSRFDHECGRKLRKKGLLGFDDVKVLMGEWVRDEDARLRREAVDFRLDEKYDHWLLDEFQDTSPAEWRGIVPLLDEAAMSEEGTVFVVGDKKQAIYGWRGGDVRLFDEISEKYGRGEDGIKTQTMPDSWRSCTSVLALVNQVCGDMDTICSLFGADMERRWQWEQHVTAKPNLTGEVRVEVVGGGEEERLERMVALLKQIGIGKRKLTCGVLVRDNDTVREIAERLRSEGFDVIEEGRRLPTVDNPVGIALHAFVRWLADPADGFAKEVLQMSPLAGTLQTRYGQSWNACWESALLDISRGGYAGLVESLVEESWQELSEFGQRRAADVMGALAAFDAAGSGTARAAARWLEGLEVAQSPGMAAVQVMTIHKSKGLGFDVVVLPEIEKNHVADRRHYQVAEGTDSSGNPWYLQAPPSWVRKLVPMLATAESAWEQDQYYEAMCLLYVALTRAKQGLYVFMDPPSKKAEEEDKATLANWLYRSIGGEDFQCGDPNWFLPVKERDLVPPAERPQLGQAVPLRGRTSPSGAKKETSSPVVQSTGGMRFGSEVHAVFEQLGWIDEINPGLPADDAGRLVGELLQVPGIRTLFERNGRSVECYREQPVEDLVNGKWLSGVIDRLHVHRKVDGSVEQVEIIDYKTDAVDRAEVLLERYAGQMEAYRNVMSRVFATSAVRCLLVSTKCKEVMEVGWAR